MKISSLLLAGLSAGLLAGCVASDGRKPLKDSDPTEQAAKTNVQLGVAYMQQGNLPVAKEKLERSLKQNPKDPDVHTSLGLLYDRTDEDKLADKHFREALRLAPERPDISNNYAIYLCKRGRIDEGIERFGEVAKNKLYRTPEVALVNSGVCLRDAKRLDEAQAKFGEAIKVKPNYSEATVQLASLQLERGNLSEARAVIDNYLNFFRPNADVLYYGVTVSRAANDRLNEEKYARRLRLEFPDSPQARALPRK